MQRDPIKPPLPQLSRQKRLSFSSKFYIAPSNKENIYDNLLSIFDFNLANNHHDLWRALCFFVAGVALAIFLLH